MKYVLPIGAMLCTAWITLLMLVFTVAGAANAGPEQLSSMTVWAGGLTLLSLGCIIASIVLLRKGRWGRAALVALVPTLIMVIILFATAAE